MNKKNINIFETFSGIGAQTKALDNIKSNKFKSIEISNLGISEWYIDAIIAYSKIHHLKEFNDLKTKIDNDKKGFFPQTKNQIINKYKQKQSYVFSSNSKTPSKLENIKEDKLKELYIANKVSKNFGSITEIKGKNLPNDIDIFTYSFPCQALSLQGKQGGLSKDSQTTSSLVWQVLRLLEEAKESNKLPKVLLMENVKALFSVKFKSTWEEIKSILDEFGYNTYDTIINSADKGSVQNRERVFAVSVLKSLNKDFKFNESKKKRKEDLVLKHILENKQTNFKYKNELHNNIKNEVFKRKNSGIISLELQDYTTFASENILYSIEGKSPTITASGANSRIKILDNNNNIRELTPFELWRIMGFDDNSYLINENLSRATLARLAGNSIAVESLEDIFEDILEQIFEV